MIRVHDLDADGLNMDYLDRSVTCLIDFPMSGKDRERAVVMC